MFFTKLRISGKYFPGDRHVEVKPPIFVEIFSMKPFISYYLSLALLTIVAFSCKRFAEDPEKKIFRYNESAGITSLDPAFAKDQANIWAVNQLFNGLVQLSSDLHIQPCIAKSWRISDDGLTYTFTLRGDVFFHDNPCFPDGEGRRLIASDFVFSLRRLADPQMASPGAWILNDVAEADGHKQVSCPDDSTLIIRLKRAFPPFLGLLTTQYASVIPVEAVQKYGAEFRKNPVGTGPFRFKIWKEGVKMVFVKNPRYFESEHGRRLPLLDAVAISFLADRQSAFLEFVKGRLDFLSGIDPGYKDELLTRQGQLNPKYKDRIRLLSEPYLNTEYLGILVDTSMPAARNSPLRDIRIRQALSYGCDRVKMIRFLRNNLGTPGLQGVIPPGMPGFDSAHIRYPYNPEKARQLLKSAGYPDGKGMAPITLTTTSDYIDLAKFFQSQLAELGIRLVIDMNQPAAVREMKAQAKLEFFRASWIADYPDAESYLSLFYSPNFCPGGPNYTHFSNPDFDELYKMSMSIPRLDDRIPLYKAMDSLIMSQAPVVILYYDKVLRFTRNNINGLGTNPMNLLDLKRVVKE